MDDPVPTKKQLSPLLSLFCHLRKVGLRVIFAAMHGIMSEPAWSCQASSSPTQ